MPKMADVDSNSTSKEISFAGAVARGTLRYGDRTVTIAPDFGGYWKVMRGGVALMTGLDSEAQARRWAEARGWEVRP